MTQSQGKKLGNWNNTRTSKDVIQAVSDEVGIATSSLVIQETGYGPGKQGTWVHPDIAVEVAGWCSLKLKIQINRLVSRYLRGELTTDESRAAAEEAAKVVHVVDEAPPAALVQWWSKRDEGREANKDTGADLKALTGNVAKGWHYSQLNEGINHAATGRTTKQLRAEAKIKKTPRDRMQKANLCLVAYQEAMIQAKWREEVETRQVAKLSPGEALRLAGEVSKEVLACCKSTKGDKLPLLEFQPPKIAQVQKALGSKKPGKRQEKILDRAKMSVLKALPAPPRKPIMHVAPVVPFEKDDLYD